MNGEFGDYLDMVSRSVSDVTQDGKPARRVTLERDFDTPPTDLWEAVTDPERLQRWFLPVSGNLKPGGRYQLEGNAGGMIMECDPPRFLSVTWEFGGGLSWLEVRIVADGEAKSRLTLSHICPVDDHWITYGPDAVGVGWDLGLLGLALYLPRRTAHFDEADFAASAGGGDYIAGASEDWRRASVASGEDSAHAEIAAQRTSTFYTGRQLQAD